MVNYHVAPDVAVHVERFVGIRFAKRPVRRRTTDCLGANSETSACALQRSYTDSAPRKRHFIDPSIATAALGASPADLVADLNTFGLLFESMCIRDLRVYASALDGSVAHYRDKSGLEADAVVHLRNGSYGFVEVKLGGDSAIEQGAQSLKTLANKIDQKRMGAPAFLMVLVGLGDFSYCREDGVMVVPIRALGV